MAIQNNFPKTRIDDLYQLYSGGKTDYQTIRAELQKINTSIVNQEANTYYDSSHTSYLAADRKQKELAGVPKILEKETCYGIVVYVTGKYKDEVYIDVPGKSHGLLEEDVFYINKETDLAIYREYLFKPTSLDYYSTPVVGGIAVVKVPKNYPSHINGNPEDAIYLHMKRPDILVRIQESGELGRSALGGGSGGSFSGGNRQETSESGEAANATEPSSDTSISGSTGEIASEDFVKPDKSEKGAKEVNYSLDRQIVVGYFRGEGGPIPIKRISTAYTDTVKYLQPAAADNFNRMMAAWKAYLGSLSPNDKKKIKLKVLNAYCNSAFRSMSDQIRIKKQYGDQAASPGRSNHQAGVAVDLVGTGLRNKKNTPSSGEFYEWLTKNAYKYGFKRTVASEHWHWEFRPYWINAQGVFGDQEKF